MGGGRRAADQTAPGRKLLEGTCGEAEEEIRPRHCAANVRSQILCWSFVKAAPDPVSLETYHVDGCGF